MNVSTGLKIFVLTCMIGTSLEISAAAVDALVQGIEIVNERTKSMYESLANDNDITAGDIVIAYLEQIPIVGTGVNIITGGTEDEVDKKLHDIQIQLKTFSGQLKTILIFTEAIKLKIDFLATNIIIFTASSTINSCSKDRNTFLLDPQSQQAKDRILRDACSHNIMDPIRQIVRILKEEQFTLDSPKLFKYMVKSDGSCDGPNIENTYKYLFGLVLDGCRTAIITEEMLYNGTSKIMLSECKQEASYVSSHYKTIFNRCLKYSCEGVYTDIEHLISESFDQPVNEQRKTLSTVFPWFKFLLAKFYAKPEFKIIGNYPLSEMIFQKEDRYLLILWASYATIWSTCGATLRPNEWFMAATFKSTVLKEVSIGMNVTFNRNTNPGIVRSCVTKQANVSYNACPEKIVRLRGDTTSGSLSNISEVICWLLTFLVCIIAWSKE